MRQLPKTRPINPRRVRAAEFYSLPSPSLYLAADFVPNEPGISAHTHTYAYIHVNHHYPPYTPSVATFRWHRWLQHTYMHMHISVLRSFGRASVHTGDGRRASFTPGMCTNRKHTTPTPPTEWSTDVGRGSHHRQHRLYIFINDNFPY